MTTNNLNVRHNVTLTEGQISTILYIMEGHIQGSDDYHFDDDYTRDVDSIFEELEGVVDSYYERFDAQVDSEVKARLQEIVNKDANGFVGLTPFQEELECRKYIQDNPITAEKVTRTQLKSIKGGLL